MNNVFQEDSCTYTYPPVSNIQDTQYDTQVPWIS